MQRAAGIDLVMDPPMLSLFMAGPDRVWWELTAVKPGGPYRLTIHHALGSIVEHLDDVTAALLREGELEELLITARAGSGSPSESIWVAVEDDHAESRSTR